MQVLGVDIGSTTAKAVLMDESARILSKAILRTGVRLDQAIETVRGRCCAEAGIRPDAIDYCISTGYGRMRVPYRDGQVTEITCHARGLHVLLPEARTIIDIGGQDSKVISLDEDGRVESFVMNDQCAAGTGRFLEVMSRIMDIPLDEIGALSLKAKKPATISSVCTVFAESEVISAAAAGVEPEDLMAGVHQSIARRVSGLVGRNKRKPFAMTGGLAQNQGLVKALEEILETDILIPKMPQFVGALGAAHIALERAGKS